MKLIKTSIKAACAHAESQYVPVFDAGFQEKFGIHVTTAWNFEQQALVTMQDDDADFTQEQMTWMKGFTDGYLAAVAEIGAMVQ